MAPTDRAGITLVSPNLRQNAKSVRWGRVRCSPQGATRGFFSDRPAPDCVSFRAYSPRAPVGRGTGRASVSLTDHPALVVRDRFGPLPAACLRRPPLGSRGCALPPGLVV